MCQVQCNGTFAHTVQVGVESEKLINELITIINGLKKIKDLISKVY